MLILSSLKVMPDVNMKKGGDQRPSHAKQRVIPYVMNTEQCCQLTVNKVGIWFGMHDDVSKGLESGAKGFF